MTGRTQPDEALVERDEMIAELRAIAAQRTAEADAMRGELVSLRRTLSAEGALAEANERLREARSLLVGRNARFRSALQTIAGPSDNPPWIEVYRNAGGGYEGLQAIARAALEDEEEADG